MENEIEALMKRKTGAKTSFVTNKSIEKWGTKLLPQKSSLDNYCEY